VIPEAGAGGDAGEGSSRFRRPRRTLRFELALLYTGVFFVSGLALITVPASTLSGSRSGVSFPAGSPEHAPAVAQHGSDLERVVIGSGIALAVLVVLSVGLGWLIAGRLLRPLRTITATARDISASNLHRRLSLTVRHDEFKELADTLDDLFGRLEASFESQRRFVANASHELRTPLTAERTLLQVALADPVANEQTLRTACEQVLALGDQQAALIEALLTLASSERGIEQREPFDLADVVARAVLLRSEDAERSAVRLQTSLAPALTTGDPNLVESLVTNLLDNALRHNMMDGGSVEISTRRSAGRAVLAVRNTGPVIADTELELLFQPFQQLGRQRTSSGHGLGLTIVQAIASAHGATLTAVPRPGGGLEFEVTFP
jgi:signal transduction histidine kinase